MPIITKIESLSNALRKFECINCKKMFKRNSHLKRHNELVCKLVDLQLFECPHCTFVAKLRVELRSHCRTMHSEKDTVLSTITPTIAKLPTFLNRPPKLKAVKKNKTKLFSCTQCKKCFSSEKFLVRHMAVVCGQEPELQCPYCPFRGYFLNSIKIHLRTMKCKHIPIPFDPKIIDSWESALSVSESPVCPQPKDPISQEQTNPTVQVSTSPVFEGKNKSLAQLFQESHPKDPKTPILKVSKTSKAEVIDNPIVEISQNIPPCEAIVTDSSELKRMHTKNKRKKKKNNRMLTCNAKKPSVPNISSPEDSKGLDLEVSESTTEQKDQQPERFYCPNENCSRNYKHKSHLRSHIKLECGVEPRFKCPNANCSFSAVWAKDLRYHANSGRCRNTKRLAKKKLKLAHSRVRPAALANKLKTINGNGKSIKNSKPKHSKKNNMRGKRLPCPNCSRSYKYKRDLTPHIRFECGKEPTFQCPYCPFIKHLRKHLNSHIKTKHSNEATAVKKKLVVEHFKTLCAKDLIADEKEVSLTLQTGEEVHDPTQPSSVTSYSPKMTRSKTNMNHPVRVVDSDVDSDSIKVLLTEGMERFTKESMVSKTLVPFSKGGSLVTELAEITSRNHVVDTPVYSDTESVEPNTKDYIVGSPVDSNGNMQVPLSETDDVEYLETKSTVRNRKSHSMNIRDGDLLAVPLIEGDIVKHLDAESVCVHHENQMQDHEEEDDDDCMIISP